MPITIIQYFLGDICHLKKMLSIVEEFRKKNRIMCAIPSKNVYPVSVHPFQEFKAFNPVFFK